MHLAILDHRADGRRSGIHQRGLAPHFDSLGQLANLEHQIHLGVLIHLQRNAGAHGALESGHFSPHLVPAHGQARSRVEALPVGLRAEHRTVVNVRDFHLSGGDHRVLRIGDDARERAGALLGNNEQRGQKQDDKTGHELRASLAEISD